MVTRIFVRGRSPSLYFGIRLVHFFPPSSYRYGTNRLMSSKANQRFRQEVIQRIDKLETAFRSLKGILPQTESIEKSLAGPEQAEQRSARARRYLKQTWKLLSQLFALTALSLGVATGYLALIPHVTIVETQPFNPGDPFSVPFVLSNEGPLGINSLDAACVINKILTNQSNVIQNSTMTATPTAFLKPHLEVGERDTLVCPVDLMAGGAGQVTGADIEFDAHFRPDFTFWRVTRKYRFTTTLDSAGVLHWIPVPLDLK